MDMRTRLEALAAGPKPWRYTIHYADGRAHSVPCLTQAAAMHGAERESRSIGQSKIDRATGETVTRVKITVELNN